MNNNLIQIALLTPSEPHKRLTSSFKARLMLAFLVLLLQVAIITPLIGTSVAAIAIFNVPTLIATLGCFFTPKFIGLNAQKAIKILLKVSIAKTFGSILLAAYIGLKFFSGSSQLVNMRLCAIYFGVSAMVDIVSSLIAYLAIKKTRSIIRILRREVKKSQKSLLDSLSSSVESSECGSATLSERSSRFNL